MGTLPEFDYSFQMNPSSFYHQHINSIALEEFRSTTVNIFPDALTYPEFLNQNLVSPLRVIKYFPEDPQSNLRVFYYHLLKLSFELQNQDGGEIKEFIHLFKQKVFDENFQILFSRETEEDRVLFNNDQFKRLLDQFLRMLEELNGGKVEQMVNTYPIMDIVLIHILRSILYYGGIDEEFETKIETEQVFTCLSGVFGMKMQKFGDCWKFGDSDMFCLDEDGTDLYFVFVTSPEIETSEQSKNLLFGNESSVLSNKNVLQDAPSNWGYTFGRYQETQSEGKENNFSSNFSNDLTKVFSTEQPSALNAESDLKTDLLKLQLSASKLFSNSIINPKPKLPLTLAALLPEVSAISYTDTSSLRITNDSRKQSFAYHVMPDRSLYQMEKERGDRWNKEETSHLSQVSECDSYIGVSGWLSSPDENTPSTTYKQPEYRPYLDPISKFSPIDEASLPSNPAKYSPTPSPSHQPYTPPLPKYEYSRKKSIHLADYYTDFTNSFVLPMLKEPYQSNLRSIKNRIKGSRRENINPMKF